MERTFRERYNAIYTPELFARYLNRVETKVGTKVPFRVAETPFFMPKNLRQNLVRAAREIVDQISAPAIIAEGKKAIPRSLDVPGIDRLPACIQVDFAICEEDGEPTGKVVELQAFPSLYALMVLQTDAMSEELQHHPGLDRDWSIFYSGHTRASFVEKFRRALLDGHAPEEVVLLDLEPREQKTYPDFVATTLLTGVEPVGPGDLTREGRQLFRVRNGQKIQVKRIYNRIVFDELEVKGSPMPFDWTDDLDVTWVCHPNWYWVWSKHTLPRIDHPAVPRARLVSDLFAEDAIPKDLSKYVLKPLFSFAGTGVLVDPTLEDVMAIPVDRRAGFILQEKITYSAAIRMPSGEGVKAEVRMMFLREPNEEKPELVLNLVRLSRGKMLGVDQNKDFDWVGGSIGIWPAEDGVD